MCLDQMEKLKGADKAIITTMAAEKRDPGNEVVSTRLVFLFLVTELSREFWLRNLYLSYYECNMVHFYTAILVVKAVRFCQR